MNPYSLMLQNAATEMRQFQQNNPEAKCFETRSLEQLAVRLEHASRISEAASAEREIQVIARICIDSGPLDEAAMSSFYAALDAVQRTRKRRSV